MEKLFILWHSVKSLLRPDKSPAFIFNPISTSASSSLRGGGSNWVYYTYMSPICCANIYTIQRDLIHLGSTHTQFCKVFVKFLAISYIFAHGWAGVGLGDELQIPNAKCKINGNIPYSSSESVQRMVCRNRNTNMACFLFCPPHSPLPVK